MQGFFSEARDVCELVWTSFDLPQCLVCFELAWISLWNSTCKVIIQKWWSLKTKLQLMANGWDNLGRLCGVCWKRFGGKRTSGLWFGNQNAEAVLFCKILVFWCTRVFEDWLARVFDLRQYAKVVWNGYHTWFYQIPKLCDFGKLTWFWRKVWKDNAKGCTI